jgi:chemotaxis protein CheX
MGSDAAVMAYREYVVQVVEMVFQTMLGLEVEPHPKPWDRSFNMVTAAVYFAGPWNGAVLLECTQPQACRFAQLLMSIETPDTLNEDVRDALGELANMLAGNLKAVLPHGTVLSMPSVIEGADYSLQMCGKKSLERVPFACAQETFGVTLVETFGQGA